MSLLIESNDRLHNALVRIHDANSGIVFKNKTDDFKILVRNDPEGGLGHFMTFEVLIVVEDVGDDILSACLDNYVNAVGFESPDSQDFLIDSFEFDKRQRSEEEIEEFREFLNALANTTVCPCGKRFIHDDKDMCIFCDMTATPEKLAEFDCPICLEKGYDFHSKTMKCCGNRIHVLCDSTWYRKGNKTCAFCREELPKRENQPNVVNIEMLVSSIAGAVERRMRGESDSDTSSEEVE
jgi:hypothetical protein